MQEHNARRWAEFHRRRLEAVWASGASVRARKVDAFDLACAVIRKWGRAHTLALVERGGSMHLDVQPTIADDTLVYYDDVDRVLRSLDAWELGGSVCSHIEDVPDGIEPYSCACGGDGGDGALDLPVSFDLGVPASVFYVEGRCSSIE